MNIRLFMLILILLLSAFGVQADLWEKLKKSYQEIETARHAEPPPLTYDPLSKSYVAMSGEYQNWKASLHPVEIHDFELVQNCADCPELIRLSRAINQILAHEHSIPATQEDALPAEIGRMEAMYTLLEVASGECDRKWHGKYAINTPAWQFDERTAGLLFSHDFSTGQIGAVHVVDQRTRVYIYRVLDQENDKIVRIVVDHEGKAQVTIWRLTPAASATAPFARRPGPTPIRKEAEPNEEYFRLETGPVLKMHQGMPEDLLILNGGFRTRIVPGLKLQGETLVSAKSTFLRTRLSDQDGRDYVYISAGQSGGRIGVPYSFALPSLEVSGEIAATDKYATTETQIKVADVDTGRLISRFHYNNYDFSIEHVSRPLPGTRLSIRYENTQMDKDSPQRKNSVWINFGGSF